MSLYMWHKLGSANYVNGLVRFKSGTVMHLFSFSFNEEMDCSARTDQ
jgi:hypothetical protein